MMGNRGILHEGQEIVRQWRSKAWVTCLLDTPAKLKPRKPFSPGTYSELFFLDEATAFAAGHRPCRYCQRPRFDLFKSVWVDANAPSQATTPLIGDIDKVLHCERIDADRRKVAHERRLADLPTGTFFEFEGDALMIWENHLLRWSFDGYTLHRKLPADEWVTVLTPASIVRLFQSGYVPCIHPSAAEALGLQPVASSSPR